MKWLKKLRDETGEEKFVWRVITIGCTLLTSYTVTVRRGRKGKNRKEFGQESGGLYVGIAQYLSE